MLIVYKLPALKRQLQHDVKQWPLTRYLESTGNNPVMADHPFPSFLLPGHPTISMAVITQIIAANSFNLQHLGI